VTHLSRRLALKSAVSSALLAIGTPVFASSKIAAPMGAMRLTRRLERDLVDGEKIVVERDWSIHFESFGRGLAIRGHQIDARVDAPARIARLASIERDRPTDTMFPIVLDHHGRIVSAGRMEREEDVAQAARTAEELLAQAGLDMAARAAAQQALMRIQMAGRSLLEKLPPDLFFPQVGSWRDLRKINLPGGGQGEFEVQYQTAAAPRTGWLETARRDVVTRIGSSARRSSEIWSMVEA